MIYLFRIISDEDEEFCRDLVIEGSDTFLDFHHTLQKDLGYDPSQLASFVITNSLWEKKQEITLMDMLQDPDQQEVTMNHAKVEDYITEEDQRLIYLFDFFSERAFFIELIEKTDQSTSKATPFIGKALGDAPPQLSLDILMDETGTASNEMDPEELPDDLRIEDLDPDMFDNGAPEDF